MKLRKKDKHYFELVTHILNKKDFKKIKNFSHHGTNRLKHSMRVSYYSYKIARFFKLDYKASAISGLLHDFFLGEEDGTPKNFFKFQIEHPKIAAKNAKHHFNISKKEENIIETHMFPFTKPSKYIEGWIISFVDKTIGTYEYTIKFKTQFSLWFALFLNLFRVGR